MSQPGPGRPRRNNDLLDAAEATAADVGRLGYRLLSLGLNLLPHQSRTHMHNAVRELSYGFVRLPGDFAAVAGEAIESWAADSAPASSPVVVPPVDHDSAMSGISLNTTLAPVAEVAAQAATAATVARAAAAADVAIAHIEYDPPGRDLDGEYVLLRNTTGAPIDLAGWRLEDGNAKHVFAFPAFTLAPGAEVKLWTKAGSADAANLYWGERGAVWNNDGDTGTLRDATGAVISSYTYAGSK